MYEHCKLIEKKDTINYDILLKMELRVKKASSFLFMDQIQNRFMRSSIKTVKSIEEGLFHLIFLVFH
ncbi:hypothetical protein BTO06_05600 [Tenacibaculum sp. SZ-18]|nr:hypothetical protein BTO06_05600 [Tenacibaculum sp. SZ-18]